MIPSRSARVLRGALALAPVVLAGAAPAAAQPTDPRPATVEVATVEVTMKTRDGTVACGPGRVTAQAHRPLRLRVENRARRPIRFVAPAFFAAAEHPDSSGFAWDATRGASRSPRT